MSRRNRPRDYFDAHEAKALLIELRQARHAVLRAGASLKFGCARYTLCHDVTKAIDAVAENITGRADFLHGGWSTTPAPSTVLDDPLWLPPFKRG